MSLWLHASPASPPGPRDLHVLRSTSATCVCVRVCAHGLKALTRSVLRPILQTCLHPTGGKVFERRLTAAFSSRLSLLAPACMRYLSFGNRERNASCHRKSSQSVSGSGEEEGSERRGGSACRAHAVVVCLGEQSSKRRALVMRRE